MNVDPQWMYLWFKHIADRELLVLKGLEKIMATLAELKDKVTVLENRGDALIELVKGLAQQVRDLKPDQAAIDELANRIDAQAQEFADAVDANTTPPSP